MSLAGVQRALRGLGEHVFPQRDQAAGLQRGADGGPRGLRSLKAHSSRLLYIQNKYPQFRKYSMLNML